MGEPVTPELRTFFLLEDDCSWRLDVKTMASAEEVMKAGAKLEERFALNSLAGVTL